MELTAQEKILEQQQQQQSKQEEKKYEFPWLHDQEIFNKWKEFPGNGCKLEVANIKQTHLRDRYWIPCGKPDVMGLNLPRGTRGGARPCGATWGAFGGVYYQGSTQRAYCTKCWYAYCLNKQMNLKQVYERLGIEPKEVKH